MCCWLAILASVRRSGCSAAAHRRAHWRALPGKSQLLRAVHVVAPRGVYVSGGYASAAGLTVAVTKEKGTGDFTLEAGALVLGDQGIVRCGACFAARAKLTEEYRTDAVRAGRV